jgi:hypothetical protein
MSESDSPRRVIAEIRLGADQSAIPQIGSRSIHHCWQLMARDFQDILLAPQRRPDNSGIAWTWREPAGSKPATPAELAGLRERLTAAGRSFAKNLEGSELGPESLGGLSAQEGVDQLKSRVNEMVAKLTGMPDAKLGAFVCRTDGGLRLHSWGTSVAAQPFFPDARDCEVSGTVLVGGKGAPDFDVVIESRTGVCLARARSDASGGFRLQKVGPGTHRVRVISDRVDFPVSGVVVTVERTSITNLELSSTSVTVATGRESPAHSPDSHAQMVAPISEPEEATATVNRATPWRHWPWGVVIAITALAVAGGGWWVWNWWQADDRRPDVVTGASSFSGGRLVAKGGVRERVAGSRLADLGRTSSGASAAGPNLSPMPGRNHPGSPRSSSAPPDSRESPSANPEDAKGIASAADRTANHARPEKNRPETTDKPDAAAKAKSVANDAPENAPQPADAADTATQEKAGMPADASKSPPPEKPSKLPGTAPAKSPDVAPQAGPKAVPESALSGDEPADVEATADRLAGARSTTSGARSGKISPEIESHGAGSSAAQSDDADDMSGAPAPGDAPPGASNTKAGSVPSAEGAGGNAPSVGVPPAAKGSPMAADESPDQTSASDSRPTGSGAPAPAVKGQRAVKAQVASTLASAPGTSASQAGSPESEEAVTERAASAGQQSEKPGATPAPNQGKRPPPAAPPAFVDAKTAGAAEAADAPPDRSRLSPTHPASASKSPAARAPRGANTQPVAEPESSAQETASISSDAPRGALPGAEDPGKGERLSRQVRLRVSSWRPQLVQDVILPTEPVRADEDDAIERLREQYLQERQRRIPVSFRNPVLWNGCLVEVSSADLVVAGQLRWRDATGAGAGGATVSGARAEIAWSGGTPPANGRYVLCQGNGREIAEIAVEKGGVVVKVADQVRCWYWVAVESAAADSTDFTASQSPRFDWQLSQGAALPDASRRDDRWRKGRMLRLDLPVDFRESAGTCAFPVVLVDRVTGWAIGSQIEQTPVPYSAH